MSEQLSSAEILNGTVVSQQANFYYVKVEEEEIACSLRGRLKKEGETPSVGDRVVIHLEPPAPDEKRVAPREGSLSGGKAMPEIVRRGAIDAILPRKNLLKRPTIANVDQVLLVSAADSPPFSPLLLDKFLVLVAESGFEVVIVINKRDLAPPGMLEALSATYKPLGYTLVFTQASAAGVEELLPLLKGKTTVLAGPSGVGKSSLLNAIQPGLFLRAQEVSLKLQRGRHTTRHAALYPIESAPGALLADTPGFSALELDAIDPAELGWYFPEMREFIPDCKFSRCLHVTEPDCAVKAGAHLAESRYDSYVRLLDDLLALKKQASERTTKEESGVKRQMGALGQERRLVKVDVANRAPDRRSDKQKLNRFVSDEQDTERDAFLEDEG